MRFLDRPADRRGPGWWIAAGLAWGLLLEWGFLRTNGIEFALPDWIPGAAFVTAGAVARHRRPENSAGRLMLATGFLAPITSVWAWGEVLDSGVIWTLGELLRPATLFPLGYLLLSFPRGKLLGRWDRLSWVALWAVMGGLYTLLLLAGARGGGGCSPCPLNLVDAPSLAGLGGILARGYQVAAPLLAVNFAVRLVTRWARSSSPARSVISPVLMAGAFAVLTMAVYAAAGGGSTTQQLMVASLLVVGSASIPFGFLWGLLRARRRRARVADFVVELQDVPRPEALRAGLARVLGDPKVEVAYWIEEANRFLTAEGRTFDPALPQEGMAVTMIERGGAPIGAITHDAGLLDDPDLVEAVRAAALLALENEKLHGDLQHQLEEVRASRVRLVEAADEERRRIERDIHDGAQQRLVSLALALRHAESQLAPDVNPDVVETLRLASKEAHEALHELRDLARGIHPAVLTDQGLGAALKVLAGKTPLDVSVEVDLPHDRLPAKAEAAAYFVASEALANAAKHSSASEVRLSAYLDGDSLAVQVVDDGRGGAAIADGSGLRGLADRVHALDGDFVVRSDEGKGTAVLATIPCG